MRTRVGEEENKTEEKRNFRPKPKIVKVGSWQLAPPTRIERATYPLGGGSSIH